MLSTASSKIFQRSATRTSKQTVVQVARQSTYNLKVIQKKTINKKELPYSPHVTIYKFPLPAIASISHRITGVALFAGFTAIGVTAAFSPAAVPAILSCIKSSVILSFLTKTAISVPLVYHYLAGVRHIYWDAGEKGIESVKAVRDSSKTIITATAIISFLLIVVL